MPERTNLLKASLESLMTDESALTDRVYEDFFAHHPEAREFFGNQSRAAQAQMVRETLMYAYDHIEDEPWVRANLEALGLKHHGYEISQEMYGWFVESLIRVFRGCVGAEWSDELEGEWRRVLSHLSNLMCQAGPGVPA
jgi:hemoglobin-like flavoprotein